MGTLVERIGLELHVYIYFLFFLLFLFSFFFFLFSLFNFYFYFSFLQSIALYFGQAPILTYSSSSSGQLRVIFIPMVYTWFVCVTYIHIYMYICGMCLNLLHTLDGGGVKAPVKVIYEASRSRIYIYTWPQQSEMCR